MVVNHLEKLFVTNDAATIIKELEVCFFSLSVCEVLCCFRNISKLLLGSMEPKPIVE